MAATEPMATSKSLGFVMYTFQREVTVDLLGDTVQVSGDIAVSPENCTPREYSRKVARSKRVV